MAGSRRKMALVIGLGMLALALGLRLTGVDRSILVILHLVSLAAIGVAILSRESPSD
jgi:hypothetical protein